MEHLSRSLFRQILVDGMTGKYPGYSTHDIETEFERVAGELEDIESPCELLEKLVPLISPTPPNDIKNQTILLFLIENHWAPAADLSCPITTLNSTFFGTPGNATLRSTSRVADYSEEITVSPNEILPRLNELERLAIAGISCLKDASICEKSFFLAYIHASVIRIHPFADGNGRTARFFVQYALRTWGLPPLPLPKVRNDSVWKSALILAIKGNYLPLRDFLATRLDKSPLAQDQ